MLSSSMRFCKKRERKMFRPLAAKNLVVIEKKKEAVINFLSRDEGKKISTSLFLPKRFGNLTCVT